MRTGFSRTFLFMLAGPLIWAAHLLFIYSVHGTVCARPAWHGAWAGIPAPLVILIAGLLALAAMAAIYLRLHKHMPRVATARFIPWLAGALNLLSAVAIVWESLAVLLVPACG